MSHASDGRLIYDAIAAQYDRARPGYPAALFDDIINYAQLGANARILEIGCGAGQATLPLAGRGYRIDCIELGARLAAVAGRNLRAYPNVTIQQADFDAMPLPQARYDLVLSATAFHWLDPATRFRRARDLLKPRGALALFWHRPLVTDASRASVDALQTVYSTVAPELARDFAPPPQPDAVVTDYHHLITDSGFFGDLQIKKHTMATVYDAEGYVDLLGTFSDHRALGAKIRRRLLDEIAEVIERDFSGRILRETVALLYLARRL